MRFQQIKDLMLYLEQLHQQQGRSYGRLIPQVDGERSRMLLAYLQGREDAAAAHLHDYREQMGSGVKETWLIRDLAWICWPIASVWHCPPLPSLTR